MSITEPKKRAKMPAQLVALNQANAAARAERVAAAWALRVGGKTVRQIAEALNVSEGQAWSYCREGLELARETTAKTAAEWREQMLAQIDELIGAWSPVALNPADDRAQAASAIVIRAQEHRARLLGLDRVEGVVSLGAPAQTIDMTEALKSPEVRRALREALEAAEAGDEKPALP